MELTDKHGPTSFDFSETYTVTFKCKYCCAFTISCNAKILLNRDHIFCPSCAERIEDFATHGM